MIKLARKLSVNPLSRCLNVTSCIEQVKKGSSVFIHVITHSKVKITNYLINLTLLLLMKPYLLLLTNVLEDVQKTGRCNVALAREVFTSFPTSWMIAKGDIHEENYNQA